MKNFWTPNNKTAENLAKKSQEEELVRYQKKVMEIGNKILDNFSEEQLSYADVSNVMAYVSRKIQANINILNINYIKNYAESLEKEKNN